MTKRVLTVVSHSQLSSIRACPALWGFRYGEGLQPKVTPDILVKGRVAHAGFEAGYEAWPTKNIGTIASAGVVAAEAEYSEHILTRDLSGLTDDEVARTKERDEEIFELERWMVRHHFEATADDLEHQIPLLIEHRFKVPIPNRAGRASGLYLIGDLDLVSWDRRYESLVTHEHKTTGMSVDTISRRLEMDPQTAGYMHALRVLLREHVLAPLFWRHGIETTKTIEELTGQVFYNVSRSKRPSVPKVNKDGTVSTAACDTTPDMFRDAMEQQLSGHEAGELPVWLIKARGEAGKGEKWGDKLEKASERWTALLAKQADILTRLETQADPFFQRYEYHRTDREIERWREEAWNDAARIRRAERDPKLRTRNVGNCMYRGCEYHDVCLEPEDATIRNAQFTTRAQREAARAELKEEHLPAQSVGF